MVGDFNGDGKPDLVIASEGGTYSGSGEVSVLLNNGNGTFQAALNYSSVGSYYDSVAVGDFNGDGKLDVALANYGISNVSVLLGNGNGTFQPAITYPAGSNPLAVAVGDFNGDGRPDIAVANGSGNNVSVLLNTTGEKAIPTSTTLASSVDPGESVTLVATVSSGIGSPADGEQITFLNGSASLGTAALLDGKATLTTSALTVGSHSIPGEDPGDDTYWMSTSSVLIQVVGKYNTSTSLVSSVNPSTEGEAVTFTATVTSDYSGDFCPVRLNS